MRKKEKSVLNFAESMDCGNIHVTFHTWETRNHEQVLSRLAKLGVKWDGPPHATQRASWMQGKLGSLQVTVFLPLEVIQPVEAEQVQAAA